MKKKLIFSAALVLSLGLAACEEDKTKEEPKTEDTQQPVSAKAIDIDMALANDKSIPLEKRIAKIATDLFGTTTTDGNDRNITVESMGDSYYLKMMNDEAATKKNALDYAQRNTVELLKVLKDVEDLNNIQINWQANFINTNPGSAMTVLFKEKDFDKIDLANFKTTDLKEMATYYHVT
ncbi:hypothetical protein ACFTQ7_09180 [Lysinibacillus sp. NPDC056959]|uniref:hypothetical protein n=1 Tax=Lysinibacillus sp. NPDC056959 TaxID=3345981 RepID=UPI0036393BA8